MSTYKDVFSSLAELKSSMVEGEHFRTISCDRQSSLTVISPHGGFIEAGTSHLAKSIAGGDFNLFDFQGLLPDDPWKLHITSTRFDDQVLLQLLNRSSHAVSVHGLGDADTWTIWIGGLNTTLKLTVGLTLMSAGFSINPSPRRFKGKHEKNVVNLPENHGLQLEIPNELMNTLFENDIRFSPDSTEKLSAVGIKFVQAVRRGIFLTLPGRLLASSI